VCRSAVVRRYALQPLRPQRFSLQRPPLFRPALRFMSSAPPPKQGRGWASSPNAQRALKKWNDPGSYVYIFLCGLGALVCGTYVTHLVRSSPDIKFDLERRKKMTENNHSTGEDFYYNPLRKRGPASTTVQVSESLNSFLRSVTGNSNMEAAPSFMIDEKTGEFLPLPEAKKAWREHIAASNAAAKKH